MGEMQVAPPPDQVHFFHGDGSMETVDADNFTVTPTGYQAIKYTSGPHQVVKEWAAGDMHHIFLTSHVLMDQGIDVHDNLRNQRPTLWWPKVQREATLEEVLQAAADQHRAVTERWL